MADANLWLVAPPVAFIIMLVVGWLMYKWGDSIAPRFDATREKIMSYACGLDVPEGKPQPNYRLFHVAFVFTIFHIVALMAFTLASAPGGNLGVGILGAAYLAATMVAIYSVVRG